MVINPYIVHLDNGGRIMTVVSDGFSYGGGCVYDKHHNPCKYDATKDDLEAAKEARIVLQEELQVN
jgi:hypothetical protein